MAAKSRNVIARAEATDLTTPFRHKTEKNKSIPEAFVNSATEQGKYDWTIGGRDVQMSSGFMEGKGHGPKSYDTPYIDGWHQDPTKPQIRKATTPTHGNRKNTGYNIGIDYVVGGDKQVTPWYAGEVTMARDNKDGYGNSVIVKTDYSYKNKGVSYPIYTRYSHLDSINVTEGERANPSKPVGKMGGSGNKGRYQYDEHVDFKSYIFVNGKEVQISPNLMQRNLSLQESKGTLYSSNSNAGKITVANTQLASASNHSGVGSDVSVIMNESSSESSNFTSGNSSQNLSTSQISDKDNMSKIVAVLKENSAGVKKNYGLDVNTKEGLDKAVMQYWKENNLDPKILKEQLPNLKSTEISSDSVSSTTSQSESKSDVSKVVLLLKENADAVKQQYGLDVTTSEGLGKAVMQYWKENNLDPQTLKEQLPNMKDSDIDVALATVTNNKTVETTKTKQVESQRQ